MTQTFDPKDYEVIFASIPIEGWAPGTKIEYSSESEGFSDEVGVDGDVVRVRSHDRRATVTLHLLQTSETNDTLSALYEQDRTGAGGAGVGSFRLVDVNGTTVIEAAQAWIMNDPDMSVGDSVGDMAWVIRLADAKVTHGSRQADGL